MLRESAILGAIGLTIGIGISYAIGRVLQAVTEGIAALELSTLAGVAALLAAAVLTATWMPAARATRVDPVEALRSE